MQHNNDVIILCGGKGTRFQNVSRDRPKILADISRDKPMLKWLIESYLPAKRNIVLAIGHLGDKIRDFVTDELSDFNIIISNEESPLGTGGAALKAARLCKTRNVTIMNGDTLLDIDLEHFEESHNRTNTHLFSVACSTKPSLEGDQYGNILVDEKGVIKSFNEKLAQVTIKDYTSATSMGLYCVTHDYLISQPICKTSLETNLIPSLVARNQVRAELYQESFHDYGTESRYNDLFDNK